MRHPLTLRILPETLGVFKLSPNTAIPAELFQCDPKSFLSITRTSDELSIVADTSFQCPVPNDANLGWRAFKIEGFLDFSLVGILSEISSCLAEADISLFAISTFNTDYILVRQHDFEKTIERLSSRYVIISEGVS